jgi:hypothetical protein
MGRSAPSSNQFAAGFPAYPASRTVRSRSERITPLSTGRLLPCRFTMIGAEAGEVMAAVQVAMLANLPYQKLRDAILTHPTMAEGLGSLFENVPPRSASARRDRPLAATA